MLALALALLTQDTVTSLMERWNSEQPAERDAATARALDRWERWTDEDLGALERASRAATPEAASRARDALSRIRLRRQLGSRSLELFPDLDARFLKGVEDELAALLWKAFLKWEEGKLEDDDIRAWSEVAARRDWGAASTSILEAIKERGCRPALPLVLRFRDHPAPETRAAAAGLLVRFRVPGQEAHFAALAGDPHFAPRTAARSAFFQLKSVSQAPALLKLTSSENADIRFAAVSILAHLKVPECAERFKELLKDPEEKIRVESLKGLAFLGEPRFAEAVRPFLKSESSELREEAIIAWAAMRGEAGADDLIPLLKDEHFRLPKVAMSELVAWPRGREAVASFLEGDNAELGLLAIERLSLAGAKEYLPRILDVLKTRPEWERAWDSVANAIYRFRASEHYGLVVRGLDGDPRQRLAAVQILAKADARQFAPELARRIPAADDDGKGDLLYALAQLGAEAHTDVMLDALSHEVSGVHAMAYNALQGVATSAHEKRLLEIARAGKLPARHLAAGLLFDLGVRREIDVLLAATEGVFYYWAEVLATWGGREHVPALLPHLSPDSKIEPDSAAWALARLLRRLEPRPEDAKLLDQLERLAVSLPRRSRPKVIDALILAGRRDVGAQIKELQRRLEDDRPDRTTWSLFEALLHRHEPETAERLSRIVETKSRVDSAAALGELVAQAELTLAGPADVDIRFRMPGGVRRSARTVVEWCTSYRVIVAEKNEIRLLDPHDALEYWLRRLSALR